MEDLPEILLEHIFGYLSVAERCRLLVVSRRLWAFQADYERRLQRLQIDCEEDSMLVMDDQDVKRHPEAWPQRMFQNLSHNLHTLDLSGWCTDWFLQLMAEQQLLPSLQHIGMKRSQFVTDQGLQWLSRHTGAIETIDITFCHGTTFNGTFCLRERLRDSLQLLRRQPTWLDGKFQTPFNQDQTEVHTYYADGTFSFNRENQSRGFVAELKECDPRGDYLEDKLQYTNFEPLIGWPQWTIYSYRPGVCLFKLQDEGDVRTVLVGQSLRGLRPPKIRHLMTQNTSLPMGTSTYFVPQDDGTTRQTEARPPTGGIMISKMRVHPLESLMPPEDLVADCRTACEVMRDLGEDVVNSGEVYLNEALRS